MHPSGKFYLGGYCNGALIAYEMARILEREGRRVETPLLLVEESCGKHQVSQYDRRAYYLHRALCTGVGRDIARGDKRGVLKKYKKMLDRFLSCDKTKKWVILKNPKVKIAAEAL